jgi:hypothetical protein
VPALRTSGRPHKAVALFVWRDHGIFSNSGQAPLRAAARIVTAAGSGDADLRRKRW